MLFPIYGMYTFTHVWNICISYMWDMHFYTCMEYMHFIYVEDALFIDVEYVFLHIAECEGEGIWARMGKK